MSDKTDKQTLIEQLGGPEAVLSMPVKLLRQRAGLGLETAQKLRGFAEAWVKLGGSSNPAGMHSHGWTLPAKDLRLHHDQERKGINILVIGDAHARPGENPEREPLESPARFALLGLMILDLRPDVVVSIGDFADMRALSHYDKGKASIENHRYIYDVAASKEALALIHRPIDEWNEANPDDLYEPRFVYTVGNHEYRINRYAEDNPQLSGTIGIWDLGFHDHGWEVVDFLKPIEIAGFHFSHYWQNAGGRPYSGVNHARNLLHKGFVSAVCGHSHQYQQYALTGLDDRKRWGLVAGCFFEDYHRYAGQRNKKHEVGILMLRDADDGDCDPQWHGMRSIRHKYGPALRALLQSAPDDPDAK